MDPGRTLSFTVVLNKQSGPGGPDETEALIRAGIPDSRLDAIYALEPGEDLRQLVRRAQQRAEQSQGCVLLAGGDGTLNGALPTLLEKPAVPFALLPLGTFNFFARSRGISLDPEQALADLMRARPRPVPVGLVNGEPFVINISTGFFPRVIDARERHQARFGRNRFVALASGMYTALGHRGDNRMLLNVDGREERIRSPMVSVIFNRYQVEALRLNPECIERDQLTVLVTRSVSRMGMLGLLLRGVAGRLNSAEDLELGCGREVIISPRRRRIRVAIDGETRRFRGPLRISVKPHALQFMMTDD